MGTRTAAIYCRISRDAEDRGLGVARQRADCEALAHNRGWTIGGIYSDNDISAFTGKRRPEYERMIDDLKNGAVDAVIAWHPDRLHRRPVELEAFIDVIDSTGAVVATVQAGDLDLSTASGRMTARIVGAVARHESEHKSRRLQRKKLELAEDGKIAGGGCRPFGYADDKVTVIPTEAAEIRDAARRIIAGDSLRSIVLDWQARGIKTVRGGTWRLPTVRQMLTSWRISGQRVHRGKLLGPAAWPAIITPDETARLRAILLDPARNTVGTRTVRSYLLTGFIWCGRCDTRMSVRPMNNRRRYVCRKDSGGCGRCGIDAANLEEFIVEATLAQLDTAALAQLLAEPVDDIDHDDIAALEADLEQLAHDHYVDKVISRAEFMRARGPLAERLAAAREAVSGRKPADVLAGLDAASIRASWDGYSLDRQRAVLAIALDRIVIAPVTQKANRFNPERIEIVWKL